MKNLHRKQWNKYLYTPNIIGIYTPNKHGTKKFGAGILVYSSLQRLIQKGILIKDKRSYIIGDPFFKRWIIMRRNLK